MSSSWIPILTALVAVLGGAIAYWNQKRLDRKNDLIELRRTAYQRFVETMISTTSAESRNLKHADELFEEFQRASGQLTIVASDEVLEKLANFQLDRTKSALSIESSFQELLLAFRKDVFEGSLVSNSTIKNAFPIKFGDKR